MLDDSLAQRRLTMMLLAVFAGAALLLAAVGIYGLIAYSVTQRTQEIGIRMALGARANDVLRMVLGQAAALAGAGIAIGAVGAALLTRFMAGLLYQVKPLDAVTFIAVAAALAGVALDRGVRARTARRVGGPCRRASGRVSYDHHECCLAWTIIVLLILLTGLYVAAEFAAVSARRSRLRRLAEDGNALAARILPVFEDPAELDRYIAASQIGITLSSLILGAYGQATIAPRVAPLLERAAAWNPPPPNPPPRQRY